MMILNESLHQSFTAKNFPSVCLVFLSCNTNVIYLTLKCCVLLSGA